MSPALRIRRIGKDGDVPLVFNAHFMGIMDHWDPTVTDGFAKEPEIIPRSIPAIQSLFDGGSKR
jgi:hypothetical protein